MPSEGKAATLLVVQVIQLLIENKCSLMVNNWK